MRCYDSHIFLSGLYSFSIVSESGRNVLPSNCPLRLLSLNFTLFQVVNDLLNPAGHNLRIREDKQVCDSAFDYTGCCSH